jgi:hypothetical protein
MKTLNIIFLFALLFASTYADIDKLQHDVNYLLFVQQNNNHMFPSENFVVYEDIFDALHRGIISKLGAPAGWMDTHAIWQKRHILRFGLGRNTARAGLTVDVPAGYNTLWLRVNNDVWFNMRMRGHEDQDHSEVEKYCAGWRRLNEYSYDGAAPDSYHLQSMWANFPLRYPGKYDLMSDRHADNWISGIAFSTNPWNHARNPAVAYHWQVNGGTRLKWHTHIWHNDQLASINAGAIRTLIVPVIYSGRDKLVYMVEHNNDWIGIMHGTVWVGSEKIERFRTTYINPWATHHNSKYFERYIAARIPAHLIQPGQKFIDLRVDMSMSDHHIHIREAGTHDFY